MKILRFFVVFAVCCMAWLIGFVGISKAQWNSHMKSFPRFAVGVGTYRIAYESDQRSVDYAGNTIRGTIFTNQNLAVRFRSYGTENTVSTIDENISGLDLAGLLGTNWGRGFNAFVGAGFFSEDFEANAATNDSWSGLIISYGIGYQWNNVSLELGAEIRDASDPEGYTGDTNATYTSGSFSLEYIFD